MNAFGPFLTLLTIGLVGGIVYTLATHSNAITAAANGIGALYRSAAGATLGQVA